MKLTLSRHTRYDRTSQAFHWATALLVLITFTLGPGDFGHLIAYGKDPGTRLDIVWHESLGMTIFTLTLLRLVWVAVRPRTPEFPMPPTLRRISRLVHVALWSLLLTLPLTALLALSTEANPLTLLGGISFSAWPTFTASPLVSILDWGHVHKLLGDAIVWLAGAHATAAIFHHTVLKDGVLRAMLP
ncbi:cytochrome b [Amphibiibacter pelophylacis]|uniref:Cytochrome b/b6 domain-containing protein n=1 Tax=Amphibiibacter pelophylacis TaxID=1799477 RepID=A0ACC6P2V7_9BURK